MLLSRLKTKEPEKEKVVIMPPINYNPVKFNP